MWSIVCVYILDLSAHSLHSDSTIISLLFTCLCRGPLKPKLAAIRVAWSSRTPSNISMISYMNGIKTQGEKQIEKKEWRTKRAQTVDYKISDSSYDVIHTPTRDTTDF